MRFKLGVESQHSKETEHSAKVFSNEERTLWFIWIGLVLIAIATLPFIARSPYLVGFMADLCVSLAPF